MAFPKKTGNTTAKKAAPKKAAPAKLEFFHNGDYKNSLFYEYTFMTGEDGLVVPGKTRLVMIAGSLTNENAPRYDCNDFDMETKEAVTARIASRTFAVNPEKRLKANTVFKFILRVSTGEGKPLKVGIRDVEAKSAGKKQFTALDKAHPFSRKIRSVGRIMPSAFVNAKNREDGKFATKEKIRKQKAED